MGKTLFIVPKSEETLIDILKKNNLKEGEDYLVSECNKGSLYSELEEDIKARIEQERAPKMYNRVRTKAYIYNFEVSTHREGSLVLNKDSYSKMIHAESLQNEELQPGIDYVYGEPEEMPPKFKEPDTKVVCLNIKLDGTQEKNIPFVETLDKGTVKINTDKGKESFIVEFSDKFGKTSAIEELSMELGYEMNLKELFLSKNAIGGREMVKDLAKLYRFSQSDIDKIVDEVEEIQGAVADTLVSQITFYKDSINAGDIERGMDILLKVNSDLYDATIGYTKPYYFSQNKKEVVLSEIQFYEKYSGYELLLPREFSFSDAKEIANRLNKDPIINNNYYVDSFGEKDPLFLKSSIVLTQMNNKLSMDEMLLIVNDVLSELGHDNMEIFINRKRDNTHYDFVTYTNPFMCKQDVREQKSTIESIWSEIDSVFSKKISIVSFSDTNYDETIMQNELEVPENSDIEEDSLDEISK